jgi:hypothetical protein
VVDPVQALVQHHFLVFDGHSHVNEPLFRRLLAGRGYDVDDDIAYWQGVMGRANVRACVLMSNHIYERPEGRHRRYPQDERLRGLRPG